MSDDDKAYGTAAPDAPVSRADFERALRFLNMSDLDIRENLLRLAAQVVALGDELTRRVDGVEPDPAPPGTPARETKGTLEDTVAAAVQPTLMKIQAAEVTVGRDRVWLDIDSNNKYAVESPDVPCAELLHLCFGRCCTMAFALQTTDLDEGVIRWDYGRPYMIRQRASDGYCVHNDPTTRFCTVHAHRPRTCRSYDCRDDKRVWIDYEKRIPAPLHTTEPAQRPLNVLDRLRERALAFTAEGDTLTNTYPDNEPSKGPTPIAREPKRR